MNNIDDILYELDMMLLNEDDKNSKADEAMKKAEELKAQAEAAKKEALLNQKRIAEARQRVEEAKKAMADVNMTGAYSANSTRRNTVNAAVADETKSASEEEKEDDTLYAVYKTPTYEVEDKNTKKKNRTGIAFISGVLATALLATGAWVLCRECKKGNVRFLGTTATCVDGNCHNNTKCDGKNHVVCDGKNHAVCDGNGKTVTGDGKNTCVSASETKTDDVKTDVYDAGECTTYIYNYDQNVVTVETGADYKEIQAGVEPSKELFTTTDTTSQFVDVEGTDRVIVNPVNEPEIDINAKYVELTTEKFEDLTTALIKKYESLGLQVSREKIIKYVMIRNIDKLKQDNPELVKSIIGTQTVEKVYTDFEDVISAITTYNWLDWDRYHDVDRLLSSVDGVFDEVQRAKAAEIERRSHEIGRNYQNEEVYNDLTYSLLRDMINPLNPIYGMEDGVSLGVQWINIYPIRERFGTNKYINLHVQVEELAKQFITIAGDSQKDFDNALSTGNMASVKIMLNDCLYESAKILTH